MGQTAPLTSRPALTEDRMHDLPEIAGAGVAGRRAAHPVLFPGCDHRFDQRPMFVGHIARIWLALIHPAAPAGRSSLVRVVKEWSQVHSAWAQ